LSWKCTVVIPIGMSSATNGNINLPQYDESTIEFWPKVIVLFTLNNQLYLCKLISFRELDILSQHHEPMFNYQKMKHKFMYFESCIKLKRLNRYNYMNKCGWWKELDSYTIINQYSIVCRKNIVIHVLNRKFFSFKDYL